MSFLTLSLEIGYPSTFQDDHKRCVSLKGSYKGVQYHSVIIFKGSLKECEDFVAAFDDAEAED